MNTFFKKNYAVFSLILIITFILRIDTFFVSSYDWDESLYFLGAKSLLDGNLPYLEVWDHKPPSIFFMHALSIAVFGDSFISIRISACLAIALTGFALFQLLKRDSNESLRLGMLSAVLFIFAMNLNGGKAANSEVYYLPFIVFAFVFVKHFHLSLTISPKLSANWFYILLSGIFISVAGSINYLAFLYGLPLAIYILSFRTKDILTGYAIRYLLILAALGLSGIAIIFGPILLVYYLSGNWSEFIYANFTANTIYISVEHQPFSVTELVSALANQFSANWLAWGLAASYFLIMNFEKTPNPRNTYLLISLGWLTAGLIAVLVSRLYWPHYFLQMNPGVCILAGLTLNQISTSLLQQSNRLAAIGIIFILTGGYYNSIKDIAKESASKLVNRYVKHIEHWGDTTQKIAHQIANQITHNDYILVADYNPMIYALSGAKIPTKYVFPPFLIGKTSAKMLPISLKDEMALILAKRPIYIIKKSVRPAPEETNDLFYNAINVELASSYILESQIDGIDLYKLKQDAQ